MRLNSFVKGIALAVLLSGGAHTRAVAQAAVMAPANEEFSLVSARGLATPVVLSAGDAPVVAIAARAFAADAKAVTGHELPVTFALDGSSSTMIVAGTLGRGGLVDRLRGAKKIDVMGIEGQWESYAIRMVNNPAPGVQRALVVAGSDPRGTAYGILELSRRIGVSPWIWWADVPPPQQRTLSLKDVEMTSKPPSVRYRGIFINDEDFGFRVWAGKTQDTGLGNIGPKAYARVFELLLRLRANTLWPAMHPGSRTFNASPENAKLAAEYGIVMGSSHAEPMLRNNVAEWDEKQRGQWDYEHNRESVLKYWDQRVAENGHYENIYTMGMRGIHDSAMPGSGTSADKAKLVEKIVDDQREILANRVDPTVEKIPQVLWMYKEVLDLYRAGMKIPPDITLGWTDDNYGYIRQLSDSKERARDGGSGVYYHVSYWGAPHDYLWLCTTPPELIEEEMTKAYDYGARKIWILNVGDIKPAELDIDYFMQLAWDEPGTAALNQEGFLRRWVGGQFPASVAAKISDVLNRYYQLNFPRKPEFMGFNNGTAKTNRTRFNPLAFGDQNEGQRTAFNRLLNDAEAIDGQLPPAYHDAFFELVLYPVKGAALMNDKMLLQDEAALYAKQGRTSAPAVQAQAADAYAGIQAETDKWQRIEGGKWAGVMSAAPHTMAVFGPVGTAVDPAKTVAGIGVSIEGYPVPVNGEGDAANVLAVRAGWIASAPADRLRLAPFNRSEPGRVRFFDVFNASGSPQSWTATASQTWIKLDANSGHLEPGHDQRVKASVDWSQLAHGGLDAYLTVTVADGNYKIPISVSPETVTSGAFVEDEGSISMPAMLATRETGNWQHFPDLSPSGEAVGIADVPARMSVEPEQIRAATPHLDYEFITTADSTPTLDVLVLPVFAANGERKARYAVSVDNGERTVLDSTKSAWEDNVLRNSAVTKLELSRLSAGTHTLKFWYVDPGVLLQHLVLHTAQGPIAYPVPPETEAIP